MNVASFVHQRQCGVKPKAGVKKSLQDYVETKFTESFINKPCEISGKCRSTFVMQFSPDGTKIASAHGDHSVQVSEIATGHVLRTLEGHPRTPWCLAYHPSSPHILASGCLGGQVRIWDLYGHGCEIWETDNSTVVASLTFHPVDHVLVIAAGNTLYFWDWSRPEPFAQCRTKHEYERIRWVKFDSQGSTLYTGICNSVSISQEPAARHSFVRSDRWPRSNSGQNTRLLSAYDDLMGVYEDYRRTLVMDQLLIAANRNNDEDTGSSMQAAGEGVAGPSHIDSTASQPTAEQASDLSMRDQHVRSNEQLFSSYASRLALRQPPRLGRGAAGSSQSPVGVPAPGSQLGDASNSLSIAGIGGAGHSESTASVAAPSLQSVFGSLPEPSPLLNPTSDPLLSAYSATVTSLAPLSNNPISVGPQDMGHSLRARAPDASAFAPRFLAPPVHGLSSNVPPAGRDDLLPSQGEEEVTVESLIRNILPLTNPPPSRRTTSFLDLSRSHSNISSSASASATVSTASQSSVMVTSASTNTPSQPTIRILPDPTTPGQSTNVPLPRSLKPFQSIRERLKSSTPLANVSKTPTATAASSVSHSKEIPKVTVLPGTIPKSGSSVSNSAISASLKASLKLKNKTSNPNTVQSDTIPKVTILPSCSYEDASHSYTSNNTGISDQGGFKPSFLNTATSANVVTLPSANADLSAVYSETSVINPQALVQQSTSNSALDFQSVIAVTSAMVCPNQANTSNRTSVATSMPDSVVNRSADMNPALTSGLDQLMQHYSAQPLSSSIPSSSMSARPVPTMDQYPGVFPRPPLPVVPGAGYAGPQQWPTSRSQYMSIMGPYLMSRGVMPVTNLPSSTVLEESMHDIPAVHGTNDPVIPMPLYHSHSRDQASSDTETELSAHLSSSGAYFMPITEDQRRSLSSLSANRNSGSALFRQQSTSAGSTDSIQGSRSSSQEIELIVDQNENYTTNRPGAVENQNISLTNYDSNNNSIHIVTSSNNTTSANTSSAASVVSSTASQEVTSQQTARSGESNQDYMRLRDSFVSMTDQIEREMNELNRRINSLRDSFNQSIQSLRHDRRRYETLDNLVSSAVVSSQSTSIRSEASGQLSGQSSRTGPLGLQIPTNIRPRQSQSIQLLAQNSASGLSAQPQPPTLLESATRHVPPGFARVHSAAEGDSSWQQLHRHYLHPHYSSSILDDTINRPNNALQSAINRAIAGAFIGTGEQAVANNIINQTHRIQAWDFSNCDLPDITSDSVNVVVPHCKLHNDTSADISQNGTLLATFVPSHQGFPDDNILAVYSLEKATRGQCLYTKKFGPNAISVSLSPSCSYVLVGLAAKRLSWVFASHQMVAQIYKLDKKEAGERSMKHVKDVSHTCRSEVRTQVSGNCARWLPLAGQGLVYGTNRGDLNLCVPGVKVVVAGKGSASGSDSHLPWVYYASPVRVSAGTQTAGVRRSASTQTDSPESEQEELFV